MENVFIRTFSRQLVPSIFFVCFFGIYVTKVWRREEYLDGNLRCFAFALCWKCVFFSFLCCRCQPNWKYPAKIRFVGCLFVRCPFYFDGIFFTRCFWNKIFLETLEKGRVFRCHGSHRIFGRWTNVVVFGHTNEYFRSVCVCDSPFFHSAIGVRMSASKTVVCQPLRWRSSILNHLYTVRLNIGSFCK